MYWYDESGNVLSESDQNGVFQNDYIYLNGQKITWVDLGHGTPTTNNYYLSDHLGNTRMIVNQAGVVCYDVDYYPWGAEQKVYTNTCPVQNYKFTGKERDPDMGEDYFGARFYKGDMSRFFSPDWSSGPEPVPYAKLDNPQTLNLYSYVGNNPTTLRDLDGHDPSAPPSPDQGTGSINSNQSKIANDTQQKAKTWFEKLLDAITISKSKGTEHNAIDQTTKGTRSGVTTKVKMMGVSTKGSIHVNPSNGAVVSGQAEVYGIKSVMTTSGGDGSTTGQVNVDAFTAAVSGSAGSNGASAKGEAQVVSYSGSLTVAGVTVTATVCAACIGGQVKLTSQGAGVGAETGVVGADLVVQWGGTTIAKSSAEAH